MSELTRAELVQRIERLLSCDWSPSEAEALFAELERHVPCPYPLIQDIIFHNEELSPEEMLERMLAYRPIQL